MLKLKIFRGASYAGIIQLNLIFTSISTFVSTFVSTPVSIFTAISTTTTTITTTTIRPLDTQMFDQFLSCTCSINLMKNIFSCMDSVIPT